MLSKYPAWRLQKKMTTVASTRAVNAFKDSLPSWVPKPTCYLTAIGEEMLEWDWEGGYIEITFDDYGAGELYPVFAENPVLGSVPCYSRGKPPTGHTLGRGCRALMGKKYFAKSYMKLLK